MQLRLPLFCAVDEDMGSRRNQILHVCRHAFKAIFLNVATKKYLTLRQCIKERTIYFFEQSTKDSVIKQIFFSIHQYALKLRTEVKTCDCKLCCILANFSLCVWNSTFKPRLWYIYGCTYAHTMGDHRYTSA